jgi:dTDP-4-amino-4,6-dideoxygalactose transaminase
VRAIDLTAEPLAIHGGRPVIATPLSPYRSMGPDEIEAVARVVESDCLSGFHGSPGPHFLGGPEVRAFEAAWAARFEVRHAVSMNSATSGLVAAVGAAGVGPGHEVIVPPYTMSATAVAPLVYGATPVFVDIEPTYFCIDADAVEAAITPRTKAIIAVDLFGHPAELRRLRALADRHDLVLIEDAAQAPTASEHGRWCGTVAHIGVFSLNFHKHIHTGEGGVCVTDDDALAERLQLIRNHGENLVPDDAEGDSARLFGFNFRLTELSAAVGRVQLAHVDEHVERRRDASATLSEAVADLDGITAPTVRSDCRHVYYVWTAKLDEDALGVSRDAFSAALAAEGVPHGTGYVAPLYRLPVFRALPSQPVSCPVTERMHEREVLQVEICSYDLTGDVVDRIGQAIRRVHAHRDQLRS